MAEFVLTPQVKAMSLKSIRDLTSGFVFIVSAETSKPIRCHGPMGGKVTADGGLGPAARFRVHYGSKPHQLGNVVRFENAHTGKFLNILGGKVTGLGKGGEHCDFILHRAQQALFMKKHMNPDMKLGFAANGEPVPPNKLGNGSRARFFIFDVDQVAKPQAAPNPHAAAQAAHQAAKAQHQAARAQHDAVKAQQEAARAAQQAQIAAQKAAMADQRAAHQQAVAQQKAAAQAAHHQPHAQAEFVLTPNIKAMALKSVRELREGTDVFIVSAETSKPINIDGMGNITANGNLSPHSRFHIRHAKHNHRLGPVVRFENVATRKFLCIRNRGAVTTGGGAAPCELIVETAQQAVFLKSHQDPQRRIGFEPNGAPVEAGALGNGSRGRFFIFDCNHVAPAHAPMPVPAAIAQQHHHPHPHPQPHHHPQPHQHRGQPAQPRPGQKCLLRIGSDPNMHLHVQPHKDMGPAVLKRGHHQGSEFVLVPTVFANTFLIRSAHSNLHLHISGGSKDGQPLVLHGDEQYARKYGHSKFQFVPTQGHRCLVKVQNENLCWHALGGSAENKGIHLHGDQGYNRPHGHANWEFIPL